MKTPVRVTKDSTGLVYHIPEHWHKKQLKRWLNRQKTKRQHTHAQGHIRNSQPQQLEMFERLVTVINH